MRTLRRSRSPGGTDSHAGEPSVMSPSLLCRQRHPQMVSHSTNPAGRGARCGSSSVVLSCLFHAAYLSEPFRRPGNRFQAALQLHSAVELLFCRLLTAHPLRTIPQSSDSEASLLTRYRLRRSRAWPPPALS